MVSQQTIDVVKATVPVLRDHGADVTSVFYRNMLTDNPELKSVFNQGNQATGHQAKALADAVYAYARHIETPAVLGPAIKHITQKHASLFIKPEQYDIVGKFLLEAFAQVLGDAFTPEIRRAWAEAYTELAKTLINVEDELYRQSKGWTDWKDFVITKKAVESSEITSFSLCPADGGPLPAYLPGQYISVRVFVPILNYRQTRQYSLSDSYSPDQYRISVKKEAGVSLNDAAHPGLVSNVLHTLNEGDHVQLSPPHGDFVLDINTDASSPLVLISAGVGLTPLLSILNTVVASNPGRPVSWIHGFRNSQTRPFADHLNRISQTNSAVRITRFCTKPDEYLEAGRDYEKVGRVDLDNCDGTRDLFLDDTNSARYFVCGPQPFMVRIKEQLKIRGVDVSRISLELFGTGSL